MRIQRYKKFLAICIICMILINTFVPGISAKKSYASFSGNRSITYVVDYSDLINFIDGGRYTLDLILRTSAPDWLKYEMSSNDRDVFLKLEFDFNSFSEYNSRAEELVGYPINSFVSIEKDLFLIENFKSKSLLNFLKVMLRQADLFIEKDIEEFFNIFSNEMTINGQKYETSSEYFCISSISLLHTLI